MEKLIITAAITGAELTKAQCPVLPMTPEEQAKAAKEAVEAGAAVIHLHVRDEQGRPSQKLEHFKASIEAIKNACKGNEPIIQFSTGGAVGEAIANRVAPLTLKPEMASFNLGTINFGEDIFVNTFSDMRALSKSFRENKTVPEFEIYEAGHLDNLKKLIKEGVLQAPFHCQFVLGVSGALSGEITSLNFLVQNLPPQSTWGVAGIGRYELPLAVHSVVMGGHVRVGLEDNIFYSKGVPAKSNAQLVERIVRIANEVGRPVANIAEARKILLH
ncbi:MAG: 3-keto-5-aminohexanoate cleavage protein [Proteobacteria bacterium]|nr:3-keto-5-aminohexanoate cleavage protein [Pseudomonadota bacterium]